MSEEVEELLRRLPLRRPSPALDGRMAEARPSRPARWKAPLAAGIIAAAAVAAAAGWLILQQQPGPAGKLPNPAGQAVVAKAPDRPAAELPPLRVEQDWSQLRYAGLLLLDERTPLRRYDRYGLRQVTWIGEGGRTLEMTVPTHEVILITAEPL